MAHSNSLESLLHHFEGAKGSEENLKRQFDEIAQRILFGGHFEVENGKEVVRIFMKDVEFYYHEMGNEKFQDPIMYRKDAVAPLPIGTLYLHVSGVDLTFEHKNEFRASILLRSFTLNEQEGELEKRPTYLYDYLFRGISPFSTNYRLRWIDHKEWVEGKVFRTVRKNVPCYDENGHKSQYTGAGMATEGGKYVQDPKEWRYIDFTYANKLTKQTYADGR